MINEHKRAKGDESDFLCSNKMIITTKEARKILGKGADALSDEYLARMIGQIYNLSSQILECIKVPNN